MPRAKRKSEINNLAETRAAREAEQPYATEIEDREVEKSQHEHPQGDANGGRRRRRYGSQI